MGMAVDPDKNSWGIGHKTPPPNLKEQKGHMTHPTQFSPIRDTEEVKLFLYLVGVGCHWTVGILGVWWPVGGLSVCPSSGPIF
jgi:hypothetical protein